MSQVFSPQSSGYIARLSPEKGIITSFHGQLKFIALESGKIDYCKSNSMSDSVVSIECSASAFTLKTHSNSIEVLVNSKPVKETVLRNNDQIRIGNYYFLFGYGSELKFQTSLMEISSRNKEWLNEIIKLTDIARTDFAVMLAGPTGSGKEVLARKIHEYSDRSHHSYVSVNCAALSPQLVESELFGHKKGSFTGAADHRDGAFVAADGGTLFLDEIGDLPLDLQPKILRAIENQEIRPVGLDKARIINVRIIAATHKNLEQAVRNGQFREDLYHRLNVVKLSPPPLVDRIEDFEDLLYYFCRLYRVAFDVNAIRLAKSMPWTGNIRELKNMVARAAALFPRERITVDLFNIMQNQHCSSPFKAPQILPKLNARSYLKDIERQLIIDRLQLNNWQQRKTAKELGIPKSTFFDKLRQLEINIEKLKEKSS